MPRLLSRGCEYYIPGFSPPLACYLFWLEISFQWVYNRGYFPKFSHVLSMNLYQIYLVFRYVVVGGEPTARRILSDFHATNLSFLTEQILGLCVKIQYSIGTKHRSQLK